MYIENNVLRTVVVSLHQMRQRGAAFRPRPQHSLDVIVPYILLGPELIPCPQCLRCLKCQVDFSLPYAVLLLLFFFTVSP